MEHVGGMLRWGSYGEYLSGALKAKGAMGNLRETKGWSFSNNNYALLSRKSPISPKKAAIGGGQVAYSLRL